MKCLWMGWKSIALVALFAGILSSCAASGDAHFRQNLGDQIVGRLHIGMTNSEVDVAIADLRKFIWEDANKVVQSARRLNILYRDNYYPKDVLNTVQVGTAYRNLAYWTNYAGRNAGTLQLFYDQTTQRLRGWVNTASEAARDRFMHERLTSQLKWSEGGAEKGMTHAQVRELIGEPVEIVPAPPQSRALYADHFWVSGAGFFGKQKIEVYSYVLENGEKRRVYLLYYPAADRLNGWGYDHAWEEVERYQRERGAQTK